MPNIMSLQFFIPELALSVTALVLLLFSLPHRAIAPFGHRASYIAMLGLAVSFFYVVKGASLGTPPLFWGLMILDKPAVFFKVLFIITAFIVIVFSQRSEELFPLLCKEGRGEVDIYPTLTLPFRQTSGGQVQRGGDSYEYYALLIGSVLGMNLLAQANNLLMIYLSLEFVSLMSYLLVGYARNTRSSEASLKYVLYGAVASGVFLYGASLYYGMTGTLDVGAFSSLVPRPSSLVSLSGIFILAGFLYKIAAVPMHAWCPDAYEGAPTPITAFLSVAPKAAGFAILMRVSSQLGLQFDWPIIIAVISAVTMTFGNLVAIPQMNVKRLLAYSSIAHAGYLLMGVACFTPKGNEAIYFYFIAYLIMNLGAFLVVQIVANQLGAETLETYKGLGRHGSYGAVLGIVMTVFLLSLTGVPPFIGFIGKFYIFSAVMESKLYWLAFIGIANSVISLYYYMRIVKTMFFDAPAETAAIAPASRRLNTVLAVLSFATIIFGLAWQWISTIVSNV